MNPWAVTIIAAVVVVIGGWFLGQALAHFINRPKTTEQVAQATIAPVTPLPSPSPVASFAVTPSPTPARTAAPTHSPKATPSPRVTPAPTATPEPAHTPSPAATATPEPATPAPSATPAPRRTQPVAGPAEPTATPAPAAQGSAARVVRAYIDALRRGDPAAAALYLGNGVPDESFIDAQTRITSISQTPNGDGSYKVAVDMQTAKGEYYETFTVASAKILDKTAIKP